MERILTLSAILLVPAAVQADPRAMMMMQGAWAQSRAQQSRVVPPKPLILGTSPTVRRPKVQVQPVKAPGPVAAKVTKAAPKTAAKSTQKKSADQKKALSQRPTTASSGNTKPAAARTVPGDSGFFGRLMYRLGRMVGAGLRKQRSAVARLKQSMGARRSQEKHVIRYGSLPVGLLLTPFRQGTLHIPLNPQALTNMRRARIITDTEYQVLMGATALQR